MGQVLLEFISELDPVRGIDRLHFHLGDAKEMVRQHQRPWWVGARAGQAALQHVCLHGLAGMLGGEEP